MTRLQLPDPVVFVRAKDPISQLPTTSIATHTPTGIRKSRRELLVAEIPVNPEQYLRQVFPPTGTRPPIFHSQERNPDGYPHIYDPDPSDPTVLQSNQHWMIFRTKNEVPPKYRERVIKWMAYLIGAVVHHVAICKYMTTSMRKTSRQNYPLIASFSPSWKARCVLNAPLITDKRPSAQKQTTIRNQTCPLRQEMMNRPLIKEIGHQ